MRETDCKNMKTDTFDNSSFFNTTGDSKHTDPEAETTQHYSTSNGSIKLSDPPDPLLFQCETKTPRVYKCRHCDFCTPSNRDLKYHFLTHRKNAAVYECKFCSFVTNHSNVRDAHKLTHLKEDAIFWHECGTCTFRSKFKANLDKHELIHKISHEQKRYVNFKFKESSKLLINDNEKLYVMQQVIKSRSYRLQSFLNAVWIFIST